MMPGVVVTNTYPMMAAPCTPMPMAVCGNTNLRRCVQRDYSADCLQDYHDCTGNYSQSYCAAILAHCTCVDDNCSDLTGPQKRQCLRACKLQFPIPAEPSRIMDNVYSSIPSTGSVHQSCACMSCRSQKRACMSSHPPCYCQRQYDNCLCHESCLEQFPNRPLRRRVCEGVCNLEFPASAPPAVIPGACCH